MSIVEQKRSAAEDPRRIRVVAIGFGAIVQSKYLPALLKLADVLEVVLIVVPSEATRAFAQARFPSATVLPELPDDLVRFEADAAFVFTPADGRAALVGRLLSEGLDVLSEKPLALTSREAEGLARLAERHSRLLLVAHTRRYDSTYPALREALAGHRVVLARATTLETPWQPVAELAAVSKPLNPTLEFERALDALTIDLLAAALGTRDDLVQRYYRWVIAESMVHDIDLMRAELGDPLRVDSARIVAGDEIGIVAELTYGDTVVTFQWLVTDGLAEYDQAFEFLSSDLHVELRYPSPFLPNTRAVLSASSSPHDAGSVTTRTVGSSEDAFLRLLRDFVDRTATGTRDAQSAWEAAAALRAAEGIARTLVSGLPTALTTS